MGYTSKEVYEYVSKKSNDPITQRKKCRVSWQDFPIYQSDLEFYDKVSPTFEVSENYAKEFFEKNSDVRDSFEYKDWKLKAKIPTPTLCPEERERRRFAFMNNQHLYRRELDNTKKQAISIFSPDKPYKVYDLDYRFSREREAEEVKDWNKNFYDNYLYLLLNTPISHKGTRWESENSDYCNAVVGVKDSYMCFYGIWLEDCMYVYDGISKDTSCVDCDSINMCSFCFDCVKLKNCSSLFHCNNCINCHNSSYIDNCIWCHDCYNCINLVNQSYCIDNKQYTKDEYQKLIQNIKPHDKPEKQKVIWCDQTECENSYGNNYTWCKDCSFSNALTNCENTKYSRDIPDMKNVYDGRWIMSDYWLETWASGYTHHCLFVLVVLDSNDCLYSQFCDNCNNIFWCIWLKDKSYCIYNKQYSKEEYNEIVPQIIAQMIHNKQWWEFLDPQLSYFGYNESASMEYYPLSKDEALKLWYKRSDYEAPFPKVEKFVPWNKLPTQWCKIIKEKKPDILKKILDYAVVCEVSKKPFRITKQEIDFYVKHNIPLPTKHPDIRHLERTKRKDPTTMNLVHCDECGEEILSVHIPWEWKRVLCEKCFYKEN